MMIIVTGAILLDGSWCFYLKELSVPFVVHREGMTLAEDSKQFNCVYESNDLK